MSDLDGETLQWLNGLKLGQKLSYVSDFQNGYYMGVIFERLNLAKGRKFKNTHDMACKFQNFKNLRDLLYENFKTQFPIQNILYNTQELLRTIRDCIKKYNRDKKEATLRKIQSYSQSKIQPGEERMFASRQKDIISSSKLNQTGKFPKKIQQIQQKLEKYRQIKTKHELIALQDRKNELQENRRFIEQHRQFELSKVRTNHQFMKQHERKVYDVWMKTQHIKKQRIEKQTNLKTFLQEKQNKFYQSMRDNEVKGFNEGLQAFQLNCIRQGIQLEHDPDRPKTKPEQGFNKQILMERIKDNSKIHQRQRKERIKRQNKKNVDAKEANIKAQKIWNENNLVESYAKKMNSHLSTCKKIQKRMNQQKAQNQIIADKAKHRSYTELPSSIVDEEKRNYQYKRRQMQYRQEQIERLQRRQKKHKAIGENILQALVHIAISNEDSYYKNNGFSYAEWKNIEKQFLSFERRDKRLKDQSRYIDSSYEIGAQEYLKNSGQWAQQQERKVETYKLSQVLSDIIQKAYPPIKPPQKNDVPLYMPLKIGFIGDHLTGKTTISQKIANKYGVMIINPASIISEAFELNKQPVAEDPKKKKQPKKPQQQNPEKLALKEWGQKLMKRLDSPANATVENYLQAIQFKLKYNYQNKNNQQILKQFQDSKIQQSERYSKALKQFQQVQKKGKKDSKKGAPETSDQPPSQRKYFYAKGFILDGINLSLQTIKKIELKLNSYISFQQRINLQGEKTKQEISNIIPVQKTAKDNKLHPGTFDLLIHLQAKTQILQSRQPSEKIQLAQTDFSKIKSYYSDFGNQKCKLKAVYSVTNQTSIDECVSQISKYIQFHLDKKYQQIRGQQQSEQKQQQNNQQINNPQVNLFSEIKTEKCENLIVKFNNLYKKYLSKIAVSFSDFDKLRRDFGKNILQIQQTFISIINRPDDKAGKILNFQQNYNRLLSQKTNIVKDAEASRHLISKLDQLNDGLWVSLQGKKNQAVLERQRVLASHLLNQQIEKVVEVSKMLMENELNLLVEIIFFIYNVNNSLTENAEEIPSEYLVLGIPPNIEPILSFQMNGFASDRLDYYINQAKQCLKELPAWLKKKQKKFKITKHNVIDAVLTDFTVKQLAKIQKRLDQIGRRVKQIYLQYFCVFRALTNKMDDWIIQGIKYQNQFVYQIYKGVKKNILEAKHSGIKDLFVKQITQILHPISGLPTNRLPVVVQTYKNKFKMLSFTIFMSQIRCLATAGRIPFKIFQAYILKRKKSALLQPQFLQFQLDIMQQYLVTDQYCNFKQVALAMLLWKVKILEEDAISEYQKLLSGSNPSDSPESYQYYKQQLTFDQFTIIPGITTDLDQTRILKTFIFQIFREEFRDKVIIKDYIDTLRQFSQLQVFRFGDTLMILNESGGSPALGV